MVFSALCERIGSALLGSEKDGGPEIWIKPGRGAATAATADRRAASSVIPLASRAEWAGRLVGSNPRRMSPRQMAELSVRLRENGRLGSEESLLLACQAELHPDYAVTIGAIGGSPASPDRPRDLLADWEERLAFALAHTPEDRERIRQVGRIIEVLRSLADS